MTKSHQPENEHKNYFTPLVPQNKDLTRISGYTAPELQKIASDFSENGFCILPSFYSRAEMKNYEEYLEFLWESRASVKASINIIFPHKKNLCLPFRDAEDWMKNTTYKLNDLFLNDNLTRSISLSSRISALLAFLTSNIVAQCNSLNLEYGSQQGYHFDTFYMPPPEGSNQLIVSSVCIEDTCESAGPLSYWPKSHIIEPWTNSNGTTHALNSEDTANAVNHFLKLAQQNNLKPKTFLGKAGDVFLWHQQLFHGGLPIKDKCKTRKSLVNHYWTYSTDSIPKGFNAINSCAGFISRGHKTV